MIKIGVKTIYLQFDIKVIIYGFKTETGLTQPTFLFNGSYTSKVQNKVVFVSLIMSVRSTNMRASMSIISSMRESEGSDNEVIRQIRGEKRIFILKA